MTDFRALQLARTTGSLAILAEDALRVVADVAARLEAGFARGLTAYEVSVEVGRTLKIVPSQKLIDLALENTLVDSRGRANKLAVQLLSYTPQSPLARLLAAVAARAILRAGPALGAGFEAGDLESVLRWKLWTLDADYFTSTRILKHPGFASYLAVTARRVVIDECRAIDRRARVADTFDPEASLEPRVSFETLLDDLDLLDRYAKELPAWESPLVNILSGVVGRDAGLAEINKRREAAGLLAWSDDALRQTIHRGRKRLRDLLNRSPEPGSTPSGTHERLSHTWRRFWVDRDGRYSLADSGFLVDPESDAGHHLTQAVAIDRLVDERCLVLLGEPAIGKSTVIREETARLVREGTSARVVNLAYPWTFDTLGAELDSVPAEEVGATVFFDSFDEGLSRDPGLATLLASVLESRALLDVRIRIACRTLEWSNELENRLCLRFGVGRVRLVELLPLRRIDVVAAANDHGCDGAAFVRAVVDREATSLAIRPGSLRFLLSLYLEHGSLPHAITDLFDEATIVMSSEEGTQHRGRLRRNADAFRRRALAARLAAACTLTNRLTLVRGDALETQLSSASFIGHDTFASADYTFDEAMVNDVLVGTSFFTSLGPSTFGWNHQQYREFLTAWYLAQHDSGLEVAERLYFGTGIRVPLPLREVASWHASLVPAFYDRLIELDPEVLLHSDRATTPASTERLVSALLERLAAGEVTDLSFTDRDYRKLEHDRLGLQLRPYVIDRAANLFVRRAAIEIGAACSRNELVEDVISIVADETEDEHVRDAGGRALARLGGSQVCEFFRELLETGLKIDPNDTLRGEALRYLWPKHIDAATMFRHTVVPRRESYTGSYQLHLYWLVDALAVDDLAAGLSWVEAQGLVSVHDIERVQRAIVALAVQHVDRDDVARAIVRILLSALNRRKMWEAEQLFGNGTWNPGDRDRRTIAIDLLASGSEAAELASELVFFKPPLLVPDDILLVTRLASTTTDAAVQRLCGRAVLALYMRYNYPAEAAVLDAVISIESPAFREPLQPFLDPVQLGTDDARAQADAWRQAHEPRPAQSRPRDLEPSRWEVASPALVAFESGDVDGWVLFVARWTDELPRPLSKVRDWATLATVDRERVIDSAIQFLQRAQAPTLEWLDDVAHIPWGVIAARAAFQFLAELRPERLHELPEEGWRRWCAVLLGSRALQISTAITHTLLARCSELDEFAVALVRLVHAESRAGHVFVLSTLPEPLPELLWPALRGVVDGLDEGGFETALGLLVRAGDLVALDLGRMVLRHAPAARAARAARVVLPRDGSQWQVVRGRVEQDPQFIDELAPLLSFREDMREDVWTTLSEDDAATLWLLVRRQHPLDSDYDGPDGYLRIMDHLERFLGRLVTKLVDAKSHEGVAALERLVAEEPSQVHLKARLIAAREARSDAAWRPLTLSEVWSTVRGEIRPSFEGESITCRVLIANGRDPRSVLPILRARAKVIEATNDTIKFDLPRAEALVLRSLFDSNAVLRDNVASARFGDAWIYEAVPVITPDRAPYVDVARARLEALLTDVSVLLMTATDVETAAVHAAMRPIPGTSELVQGSKGFGTYTLVLSDNYISPSTTTRSRQV